MKNMYKFGKSVGKPFYSSPETAIYRRKRGIADWAAVADKHYFYHGLKPPLSVVLCCDLPLDTLTNGCIDSVKIQGNLNKLRQILAF